MWSACARHGAPSHCLRLMQSAQQHPDRHLTWLALISFPTTLPASPDRLLAQSCSHRSAHTICLSARDSATPDLASVELDQVHQPHVPTAQLLHPLELTEGQAPLLLCDASKGLQHGAGSPKQPLLTHSWPTRCAAISHSLTAAVSSLDSADTGQAAGQRTPWDCTIAEELLPLRKTRAAAPHPFTLIRKIVNRSTQNIL